MLLLLIVFVGINLHRLAEANLRQLGISRPWREPTLYEMINSGLQFNVAATKQQIYTSVPHKLLKLAIRSRLIDFELLVVMLQFSTTIIERPTVNLVCNSCHKPWLKYSAWVSRVQC